MTASTPQHPAGHVIDLLIDARWIIPVEPFRALLENHSVAICDGRILDLLPSAQADAAYRARQRVVLDQHVLIPGLVNLHSQCATRLLPGNHGDGGRVWPTRSRPLNADLVRDGTLLGAAEMLRGGVTCLNDVHAFPAAAAQAVLRLGMRATLGLLVLESPCAYASDAADYLAKGLAARDQLAGAERLQFSLAPYAPYAVSDRTLERIATLAAQLDLPVHVRINETAHEDAESQRRHGLRPLERLRRLGLLGPGLIAAHAVHLDDQDIALLADHSCSIAHCPTANMNLASGIAPIADASTRGVRVGLGTDAAPANGRNDMFREMRHGALLGRAATGDPEAFDVHTMLRMATLNGAAALGLDDRIGSLRPDKCADLCAVRLDDWLPSSCADPAAHLLHGASRDQVSHVWIDGVEKLCHSQLHDIRAGELLDICALWQNRAM